MKKNIQVERTRNDIYIEIECEASYLADCDADYHIAMKEGNNKIAEQFQNQVKETQIRIDELETELLKLK